MRASRVHPADGGCSTSGRLVVVVVGQTALTIGRLIHAECLDGVHVARAGIGQTICVRANLGNGQRQADRLILRLELDAEVVLRESDQFNEQLSRYAFGASVLDLRLIQMVAQVNHVLLSLAKRSLIGKRRQRVQFEFSKMKI